MPLNKIPQLSPASPTSRLFLNVSRPKLSINKFWITCNRSLGAFIRVAHYLDILAHLYAALFNGARDHRASSRDREGGINRHHEGFVDGPLRDGDGFIHEF